MRAVFQYSGILAMAWRGTARRNKSL